MGEDIIIYELINYNLKVATSLLEEFGELHPIACVKTSTEEESIPIIKPMDVDDEFPDAMLVVDHLVREINAAASKADVVGACVCLDVNNLATNSSACDFWVHIRGFAGLRVIWDYKFVDGLIEWGTITEEEGVPFLD